jgi:hypothetical protein
MCCLIQIRAQKCPAAVRGLVPAGPAGPSHARMEENDCVPVETAAGATRGESGHPLEVHDDAQNEVQKAGEDDDPTVKFDTKRKLLAGEDGSIDAEALSFIKLLRLLSLSLSLSLSLVLFLSRALSLSLSHSLSLFRSLSLSPPPSLSLHLSLSPSLSQCIRYSSSCTSCVCAGLGQASVGGH